MLVCENGLHHAVLRIPEHAVEAANSFVAEISGSKLSLGHNLNVQRPPFRIRIQACKRHCLHLDLGLLLHAGPYSFAVGN